MPGLLELLRSWGAEHAYLLSFLFVPLWFLVVLGPKLLADSMPEGSLPDAGTGFRRSDALPIMPPAYFRYLAFLYSPHSIRSAMSHRRWLIRLIRRSTVVLYVTLFGVFLASATQGYVFDPSSEFLKSDSQKAVEAAGTGGARRY